MIIINAYHYSIKIIFCPFAILNFIGDTTISGGPLVQASRWIIHFLRSPALPLSPNIQQSDFDGAESFQ